MSLFLQRIVNGLVDGSMYAVVAVPMVLIFKATTLINFAQGELAMLGAFLGYVFAVQWLGLPIWLAAILAMALSALLGMSIERVMLRSFDPTDHLPVVLITLGIFFVVNAAATEIWGALRRGDPPEFFGDVPGFLPDSIENRFKFGIIDVAGVRIPWDGIGIVFSLILMLTALHLILNKTQMGLAFRGVSSNTQSSRLVGIRVGRVLSFGWALACAFGALGAIIVAPRLGLQPIMMAPVLIYALAAAAFGGLDSVGGAAIGGVVIGLLNSVVLSYLTQIDALSTLTASPLLLPLVLLLVVLWFKPSGLFGTKSIERV